LAVDIAGSAGDATAALELINYDAEILDLGLPNGDGIAVLAGARRIGKALPILILTARDAVEDRVAGLNAGADDYLTKPFAMTELIARIKALLRRSRRRAGRTGTHRCGLSGPSILVKRLAILEQMMRRFRAASCPKAELGETLPALTRSRIRNPIPVPVHQLCAANLEAASATFGDSHHPGRWLHPRRDKIMSRPHQISSASG